MTMENTPPLQNLSSHLSPPEEPVSRRRSSSGSGSILSRFPFLRNSDSKSSLKESQFPPSSTTPNRPTTADGSLSTQPKALAAAMSQQTKTRRRKGSLRKVALLGRGAAREKREQKAQLQQPALALDTSQILEKQPEVSPLSQQQYRSPEETPNNSLGIGLGRVSDEDTPRPSMEGFASHGASVIPSTVPSLSPPELDQALSPTISYTSTTDEEDGLTMPMPLHVPSPLRPDLASLSSGSESYFPSPSQLRAPSPAGSLQRRRSTSKHQRAKSPLALSGLTTGSPALALEEADHDYSETEWWGWVILIVTWFVFTLGIGSCLNVWSWAWDVGSTPYAPPELEDDPTLPIVGYYPALMILTSIMAWVWVVVAWVGMKYFRHAKISGD
ncbi:hypothetical protein F5Y18DRAFT_206066 [Xylariaceae sp. FL1019]|nr:hypothetical protein F5Y18DRAFT_206066 [Xylariaceae sp. FL1019]